MNFIVLGARFQAPLLLGLVQALSPVEAERWSVSSVSSGVVTINPFG